MAQRKPDKGGAAEEALRAYFAESGYFSVRGVKIRIDGFDITDVDVWLYMRASAIHRIRACVDAKNRGTPKALERIFWAKGLQEILGFEASIVATTDTREVIRAFGSRHGVRILDGNFLSQIQHRWAAQNQDRLMEEELSNLIDEGGADGLQGNWKERVEQSKSRLLTKLDFSGCNACLEDLYYFLDALGSGRRRQLAYRCVYLTIAFLLVGLDFRIGEIPAESTDKRREALLHGFAYGEGGKDRLDSMTNLIREFRPDVARELSAHLPPPQTGRPAILADFFVRADSIRTLFPAAISFEAQAYSRALVRPDELPAPMKSIFAVLLDALELDRAKFFGTAT